MPAGAVAKTAILISANAAGVTAGLQEASAKVRTFGGEMGTVGHKVENAFGKIYWGRVLGGFVMVHAAAAAFGAVIERTTAGIALQTALISGTTSEVFKAQLAVMDAQHKIWTSIPLIGNAIKLTMDTLGDRKGLEQAIKNMEEVEQRSHQMHEYLRKDAEETALRQSLLRGEPKSAQMALGAQSELRKAQETKETAWETRRKALQDEEFALRLVSKAQANLAEREADLAQISHAAWGVRGPRMTIYAVRAQLARKALEDAEESQRKTLKDRLKAEQEYSTAVAALDEKRARLPAEVGKETDEESRKRKEDLATFLNSDLDNRIAKIQKERDKLAKTAKTEQERSAIIIAAEDKIAQVKRAAYAESAQGKADTAVMDMIMGLQREADLINMTTIEIEARAVAWMGATDAEQEYISGLRELSKTGLATQAIRDEIESLQLLTATFGLSESAAKLYIAEQKGVSAELRQQWGALLDLNDAQKEQLALNQEGKALAEQLRTPWEAYIATLAKLDKMVQTGALGWDDYGRAVVDAEKKLGASEKYTGPTHAPAMAAGSQAWYSTMVKFLQPMGGDETKDMVAAQKETNRRLGTINTTLEKGGRPAEISR